MRYRPLEFSYEEQYPMRILVFFSHERYSYFQVIGVQFKLLYFKGSFSIAPDE